MAEDLTQKIGIDASGASQDIGAIVASFKSFNAMLGSVITVTERLNAENQVVSRTFQGMTDAGQKFTAQFKNVDGVLKQVAASQRSAITNTQSLITEFDMLGKRAANTGATMAKALGIAGRMKYEMEANNPVATYSGHNIADVESRLTAAQARLRAKQQGTEYILPARGFDPGAFGRVTERPEQMFAARGFDPGAFGRVTERPEQMFAARGFDPGAFGRVTERPEQMFAARGVWSNVAQLRHLRRGSIGTEEYGPQAFIGPQLPNGYARHMLAPDPEAVAKQSQAPGFFSNLGKGFVGGIGLAGGAMLGAAAASALKDSIKDGLELEHALLMIKVQSRDTTVTTDKLGASVLKLSSAFNIEAKEIAGAQLAALKGQFGDAAKGQEILTEALKLAKVTDSDAITTTKTLSQVTEAFGLSSKDASHTAGLLFEAVRNGAGSMQELEGNFGSIGAVIEPMGGKLEEVVALFDQFRRAGVSADQAGTQIIQMMVRLNAEATKQESVFGSLGARTFPQLVVQMGGFLPALSAVQEKMRSTGKDLKDFFGGSRQGRPGAELTAQFLKEANEQAQKLKAHVEDLNVKVREVANDGGEKLYDTFNRAYNEAKKIGLEMANWLGGDQRTNPDAVDKKVALQRAATLRLNKSALVGWQTNAEHTSERLAGPLGRQERVDLKADLAGYQERIQNLKKVIVDEEERLNKSTSTENVDNVKVGVAAIYSARQAAIAKEIELHTEAKQSFTQMEMEKTAVVKDQLNVQVKRQEDAYKQLEESVNHSKSIIKASFERAADIHESLASGNYSRALQMVDIGRGGPGQTRKGLEQAHRSSLKSEIKSSIEGLAALTPEQFNDSKDVDRAVSKQKELTTFEEEQFQKLIERRATNEELVQQNYRIVDAKKAELALEENIRDAATQRQTSAKAAADAELLRIETMKTSIKEATEIRFDKGTYKTLDAGMDAFDKAAEIAKKGDKTGAIGASLGIQRALLKQEGTQYFGELKSSQLREASALSMKQFGGMEGGGLFNSALKAMEGAKAIAELNMAIKAEREAFNTATTAIQKFSLTLQEATKLMLESGQMKVAGLKNYDPTSYTSGGSKGTSSGGQQIMIKLMEGGSITVGGKSGVTAMQIQQALAEGTRQGLIRAGVIPKDAPVGSPIAGSTGDKGTSSDH